MSAHDAILEARVKQTRIANRKRRFEPFHEGDLVYVSTQNLKFAKGLARKLIPKYIGPYKITRDFDNHSFRVELPSSFIQRGVHPVFHSSLLRIHVPNDDRRFPGRLDTQLQETPEAEPQWKIERILSHHGAKEQAVFEVKWTTGDITWMPFDQLVGLGSLADYLDLLGCAAIGNLPMGRAQLPSDPEQYGISVSSIAFELDASTRIQKGTRRVNPPMLASPHSHYFPLRYSSSKSIPTPIPLAMPSDRTKPRGKKGRKLPAYLRPLIAKAPSPAPKEFMIRRSREWFDAHEAPGSGAFGGLVTQVHAVHMLKCIEHNNRLRCVHAKDGISECRQIRTAPIAYDAIAASFNAGTQIEKFVEWVKPNPNNPNGPTGYTLDHLLAPSPTSQGLRVDMKFLFDPHQLDIPGYVVIPEREYNKTRFLGHQILFQRETAKEKAIQRRLDKKAGLLWKDSHEDRYAYGADSLDAFLSDSDDLPEFIEGSAGSVDAEGDPDPDHGKGVEKDKEGLLYYVDTEGDKPDANGDSAMKNTDN